MGSRTKYIRLTDWDEKEASIVLRFMMVTNDICMSYRLQRLVAQNSQRDTKEFDEGTEQYILRLASAQLFEALPIVPQLKKCNPIKIILNRNDEAREAFERLMEYKEGGKYDKSYKVLRDVRNKGMFHYNSVGHWLIEMMNKRIADGIKIGPVIWTDEETAPARFIVADQLHEMVFVYKILDHHEGKNFNDALSESTQILNDAQRDFAKLAVTIVMGCIKDRYCS